MSAAAFLSFLLLFATASTGNSFLQRVNKHRCNLRWQLSMSLEGKAAFLADNDNTYLATCLRRSVDSSKLLIAEGNKLIEIEFPPSRKSDLSVGETLDTNRNFVGEFVKQFASVNLWVVFPDKKETFLAKQKLGDKLPYLVTSIEGILQAKPDAKPELMVIVNPGFNIDEWINVPKVVEMVGSPQVIIINGNLDRLRNGYYPAIFYPGLTKVSKSYYSSAVQALFLQPIAVGGNRLGAWLARCYPGPWEILIRDKAGYEVIQATAKEPQANAAWNLAKKAFSERNGNSLL